MFSYPSFLKGFIAFIAFGLAFTTVNVGQHHSHFDIQNCCWNPQGEIYGFRAQKRHNPNCRNFISKQPVLSYGEMEIQQSMRIGERTYVEFNQADRSWSEQFCCCQNPQWKIRVNHDPYELNKAPPRCWSKYHSLFNSVEGRVKVVKQLQQIEHVHFCMEISSHNSYLTPSPREVGPAVKKAKHSATDKNKTNKHYSLHSQHDALNYQKTEIWQAEEGIYMPFKRNIFKWISS